MISGVYAPCTGFPFFRCGPLSSSTASRVEIPLEFLQITVLDASCVLPFRSCSNHSRHSFFLSSSALRSRSFSWLSAPPSGPHECSRQPLARKFSRLNTNTTPRFSINELGGVEDRSVGDVAFQLISDGKRKQQNRKRTLLAQTSFYFPKHCPCAAWILPNALLAYGRARRLAMQVKILGGSVLFFTFNQVVR